MSTKTTAKRMVPEGIDISALDYLQKGDVTRVAALTKNDRNYVSRVKKLRAYNVKILAALIKKGLDNKRVLEQGYSK